VRGNARLSHARDFLQFVDGKFIRFQERYNAQARGVG